MKKFIKLIVIIASAVFMLTSFISCKARKADTSGKTKIICTIFPEYDWVRNITGNDDSTTLTLLVKNGVDLHSFQPSVSDIIQISTCDLFVYVGGESDQWVKDVLAKAENKNMKVINLMEVLKDKVKEEEIIEGMQAEEEDNEDSEDEPEYDEHLWLSVRNAELCCKAINEALCQLIPDNASTYNERTDHYIEQLNSMDLRYKNLFASNNQTLIFCDRFPFRYFTDDYNLKYYAAFVGCSAETEASFETVAFLANKLNELNINSVFVLDSSNKKIAKTVILNAKKPSCDIYELNSMQSISLREAIDGTTYLSCMQKNLETLQKAFQK